MYFLDENSWDRILEERYSTENAAFKIVGRDKEREERRGRGGQGRNNEYRSKGISTRYKRVLFPRLL